MSLDLQGVGSPGRGLFMFGKRPEVKVKTATVGTTEKAPTTVRPEVGKVALNPYIEALQTMEKLEKARKILSPYMPAPARKPLGSQIDLKG